MPIFVITSGEYSAYHIVTHLEGEGNVETLFNEFREMLMPGFSEFMREHTAAVFIDGFYEMLKVGREKAVMLKLVPANEWGTPDLEDAFIKWLVREQGFKALEDVQEVRINIDDRPHETINR